MGRQIHQDSCEWIATGDTRPSDWVVRHARNIRAGGRVLDLASGHGRNARWLAGMGWQVEAVDRDQAALDTMRDLANIHITYMDLEQGGWPLDGQRYDGIVVCRYLHRPLLTSLADSLAPDGVLIYETFMQGHERFGRPSNPDFLLKPDELLAMYGELLDVIAFEQGYFEAPNPGMHQRICARYTHREVLGI